MDEKMQKALANGVKDTMWAMFWKGNQKMTIGEEVLIHGYIDEIRKDIVIIRNEGGYFGTVPEEIRSSSEIPNTCGDAISRQAAKKALEDRFIELQKRHSENRYETNFCLNTILELPSVTPQQRTGRWIDIQYFKSDDTYYRPKCPFCNAEPKEYSNYCPNCGAKMEEE